MIVGVFMTDDTIDVEDVDPLMGILSDSVLYGMEKKKDIRTQPPVRPPFYKFFSYIKYMKALKVYQLVRKYRLY
jgi:hypothetical protein